MRQSKKQIEKSIQTNKILGFAKRRLKSVGVIQLDGVGISYLKKDHVLHLYRLTFNSKASKDINKKNISAPKLEKPRMKYSGNKWKEVRKLVFEIDVRCRGCGSEENFHCHHSYYIEGREVWDYPLDSFITLCENCHSEFHKEIKGSRLVIRGRVKILDKIKEEQQNGYFAKY